MGKPKHLKNASPRLHMVKSPTRLADGKVYHYAYLRYEVWDAKKNRFQPKPLAALGRVDRLDEDRLDSLGGFLREWLRKDSSLPFDALKERFKQAESTFAILCSRDFGLRWLIEQAWEELGYKEVIEELYRGRKHEFRVDIAIFAMVTVQLIAPQSKRRLSRSKNVELFFPEAEELQLEQLYSAMDVLEQGYEAVEQKLVSRMAELGLRSPLLSHDSTSQSFAIRYDDEERFKIEQDRLERGEGKRLTTINDPPLRMRGHSKIHRPDLPQVVIEAVLGEHKLIMHHETHPGNTADQTLMPKVVKAVEKLGYKGVKWASDTGMNSAKNRTVLRAARFDYVMGEGVSRTNAVKAVLRTPGRYQPHPTKPELSYKCVIAEAEEERSKKQPGRQRLYIIRRNKKQVEYASRRIDRHVGKIKKVMKEGTTKEVEKLLQHSTLKRYVRRDGRRKNAKGEAAGHVLLDKKAIRRLKDRGGKSVIGTDVCDADPLEVDTAYRSLFAVEEAFKLTKSKIQLGPVRHRAARRIKAHVMIAIMAYNLTRWLERKSGQTLGELKLAFESLRVQEVQCGESTFWERVELSEVQVQLFETMGYAVPPKRFTFSVPERPGSGVG